MKAAPLAFLALLVMGAVLIASAPPEAHAYVPVTIVQKGEIGRSNTNSEIPTFSSKPVVGDFLVLIFQIYNSSGITSGSVQDRWSINSGPGTAAISANFYAVNGNPLAICPLGTTTPGSKFGCLDVDTTAKTAIDVSTILIANATMAQNIFAGGLCGYIIGPRNTACIMSGDHTTDLYLVWYETTSLDTSDLGGFNLYSTGASYSLATSLLGPNEDTNAFWVGTTIANLAPTITPTGTNWTADEAATASGSAIQTQSNTKYRGATTTTATMTGTLSPSETFESELIGFGAPAPSSTQGQCPPGQYIAGVANGVLICAQYNFACPPGEYATNFTSSGGLNCQVVPGNFAPPSSCNPALGYLCNLGVVGGGNTTQTSTTQTATTTVIGNHTIVYIEQQSSSGFVNPNGNSTTPPVSYIASFPPVVIAISAAAAISLGLVLAYRSYSLKNSPQGLIGKKVIVPKIYTGKRPWWKR